MNEMHRPHDGSPAHHAARSAENPVTSPMLSFDQIDSYPPELLDVPAVKIRSILPRPTLMHLSGRTTSPIFVSVLLHGDEDVGLKAIQQVLTNHRHTRLPRSLTVFFGNVEAAEAMVRFLPHQPDFNRIWPGSEWPHTPYHDMMRSVLEVMVERGVVASIDLHNNTGRNPYYACVTSMNAEHLHLASLFSRRVMYFQRPKGVQTQAFAQFCPAITCECGPIGDCGGVAAAVNVIEQALALGDTQVDADYATLLAQAQLPIALYRTVATWRLLPGRSITFASRAQADVYLRPDLDTLNFAALAVGQELGELSQQPSSCLEVRDESGRVVTDEYLALHAGKLIITQPVIPSMLTTSIDAIRKDCIGYFMESV